MSLDLEQPAELPDSAAAPDAAPPATDDSGALDASSDTDLDTDLDPQAPVDEDEEDEIDGVKLRGKKDALERIKAERLMQADYTRKTQEVAEARKAHEAREAQFQQAAQTHSKFIEEIADLRNVERRLKEFADAGVNLQSLNALVDTEPQQAVKLQNELNWLQAQKAELTGSITQKQRVQAMESQRATAKQVFEAQQVLARDIKGWSPELANKLTDYAVKDLGYPPEVLNSVTQPAFVKTLHKAMLYDQLQKQRTAKTPAAPAPPASRVGGGGATVTKKLSEMSDAEYTAYRQKYVKNHR
jgi:hypothetical protein